MAANTPEFCTGELYLNHASTASRHYIQDTTTQQVSTSRYTQLPLPLHPPASQNPNAPFPPLSHHHPLMKLSIHPPIPDPIYL